MCRSETTDIYRPHLMHCKSGLPDVLECLSLSVVYPTYMNNLYILSSVQVFLDIFQSRSYYTGDNIRIRHFSFPTALRKHQDDPRNK